MTERHVENHSRTDENPSWDAGDQEFDRNDPTATYGAADPTATYGTGTLPSETIAPDDLPGTAETPAAYGSFGDAGTSPYAGDQTSSYAGDQTSSYAGDRTSSYADSDTRQVVTDEAASVAADAKEGGRRVADTATSEIKDVASEATDQLRRLFEQFRTEAGTQASNQSQRAVGGLRALADELGQMASAGQQSGLATDVARQASQRAHGFAEWIDTREPGDILDEVRDFARRRPGTFLATAAVVGLIGGRLTRSLAAEHDSSTSGDGARSGEAAGATPGADAAYGSNAGTSYATDATTEFGAGATSEFGAGATTEYATGATSEYGTEYGTGTAYGTGPAYDDDVAYGDGTPHDAALSGEGRTYGEEQR